MSFTGKRTLPIDFLKVGKFKIDVVGSALEGGRNGLGQSISTGLSGGGLVTIALENCFVQAGEEHEVINWLGAMMNGSFRFINVPILTDWMGPFPTFDRFPAPTVGGTPHSDGSLFSDGSGYSQATVWGEITEVVHSGIIKMRAFGLARPLRWSDWFSIYHPVKGWRAYRYWDVISKTDEENPVYTLAMSPPLREAVTVGTRVEFARPRCVMKFAPGFTLPWEISGFWRSNPTLQFVEAF